MGTCHTCGKSLVGRQKAFCSPHCQHQRRKHTIETCRSVAAGRGGECLSTEYEKNTEYMRWKCANGHEWEIPFANVLSGNWCEQCVRTKWTTEMMHSYIRDLGGQCFDPYESMKTFINVTCSDGHKCKTTLDNISRKNRIPCWTCKPKRIGAAVQKWSEDQVIDFLKTKGGSLASKFTRVDKPIKANCSKGHIWSTTFDRLRAGHWCPHCARNRPLYFNDIAEMGKQHGLTLLSDAYTRASDKLRWKCRDDHVFYACWNSISNGSDCPYCHSGIKEAKCRFIFEESFNAKFPQTRKALNSHYQLDGYNDDMKVAFEYQGKQHYEPAWYHNKHPERFSKLQEIDKKKRSLAVIKGIAYVEIPYWKSETDDELKQYIQSEFDRLNLKPPTAPQIVDMSNFKGRPSRIDEIRTVVEQDGGKLLAARYVSMADKTITVECRHGHVQQQSPGRILYAAERGRGWCFLCGNQKISEKRKAYWQRRGRTDYDKIKKMYADGMLMKDISQELKVSKGTVSRGVHYVD